MKDTMSHNAGHTNGRWTMIENVTIETSIVEGKTRAADAPRAESVNGLVKH